MSLFTAEGERLWAEGWDPSYPANERRDGAGAVFTTAHGLHRTTWIMVDHEPDRIRYARVAHGVTAGMVTVELTDTTPAGTSVRVTYDLTALTPAGEEWLGAFQARYDNEIGDWATHISQALEEAVSSPVGITGECSQS